LNRARKADAFVEHLRERARHYRHNNVLYMWGDDFRFMNPEVNLKNMESLMTYIMKHQDAYRVTLRFATISEYMRYFTYILYI